MREPTRVLIYDNPRSKDIRVFKKGERGFVKNSLFKDMKALKYKMNTARVLIAKVLRVIHTCILFFTLKNLLLMKFEMTLSS